jgi:hypothetical protein
MQRQAVISITGALHTSPGDATIAHAGLTSIENQLNETEIKALARFAISQLITKAAKMQVK